MTIAGKKSLETEEMLQRTAVLHLIFYSVIKGGGVKGLHEIHWV